MFSTLQKPNFNSSCTFILSSTDGFNLDQLKSLSFGKELSIAERMEYGLKECQKTFSAMDGMLVTSVLIFSNNNS